MHRYIQLLTVINDLLSNINLMFQSIKVTIKVSPIIGLGSESNQKQDLDVPSELHFIIGWEG